MRISAAPKLITLSTTRRVAVALAALIFVVTAIPAAAAKPHRSARPDLAVRALSVPPSVISPGQQLRLKVTVGNRSGVARASRLAVYLSRDASRGGGDLRLVGMPRVKSLRPRQAQRLSVTVRVPAVVGLATRSRPRARSASGVYRLVACADAGGVLRERSERNNCRAANGTVAVMRAPGPIRQAPPSGQPSPTRPPSASPAPPPAPAPEPPPAPNPAPVGKPDLAVAQLSEPPATGREGGTFGVSDTIRNDGAGAAAPSATRFYLTRDPEASLAERRTSQADPRRALADLLMGGFRGAPSLSAGGSSAAGAETAVRIPVGIAPGTYYLLACADDRGTVAEAAEDNNCRVATHVVDGAARPKPIQIVGEEQQYLVGAFSDVFSQPTEQEDTGNLQAFRQSFCQNHSADTVGTLSEAIASIKRFLTDKAGADAMAQFAGSPEFQDATSAEAAAGGAIAAGIPGAALAALVRAHELEPAEASHLINAAAVASSVGLPSEALAMLDSAQRLDDQERPAMGIGRDAVALANRGQALTMLGRHADADKALDASVASEPLLTEALMTKSATTLCREGAEPAAKLLRRGRTRREPPKPPVDTSRGRESSLRDLPLPGFPPQAVPMRDFFAEQNQRLGAEQADVIERVNARDARIRAKESGWTPAQRKRHAGIVRLVHKADAEPELAAMKGRVEGLLDVLRETHAAFWGSGNTRPGRYQELSAQVSAECRDSQEVGCFERRMNEECRPALKLAHQEWLDEIQEAHNASAAYFRALSKRVSAYAVHLGDDDAHARMLLEIELDEIAVYSWAQREAFLWTHSVKLHADHCVEAPEPTTDETQPEGGPADSEGACSGQVKSVNGVLKLGPVTLKASCSSVEVGVDAEVAPWLKAFAKVTYNFRSGKMTVFAGSQADIKLGVAKGSFKSGLYVTAGPDGKISDVGWRVGPGATVGAGPAEFQVYKDEIDLSFVGAVSSTPGG